MCGPTPAYPGYLAARRSPAGRQAHHVALSPLTPPPGTSAAALAAAAPAAPGCSCTFGPCEHPPTGDTSPRGQSRASLCSGYFHSRAVFRGPRLRYSGVGRGLLCQRGCHSHGRRREEGPETQERNMPHLPKMPLSQPQSGRLLQETSFSLQSCSETKGPTTQGRG